MKTKSRHALKILASVVITVILCLATILPAASPAAAAVSYLGIATVALPDSWVSATYNFALISTGGTGNNTTWTVSAGALPTGLNLSTGGVISGTPTTMGKYSFTAHVTDSSSTTANQNLTINIKGAGNLYEWGANSYGQLGNNSTTDITTGATALSGMTGVVQVMNNGFFTMVLKSDGTVWTYGTQPAGLSRAGVQTAADAGA
jgi:Putative Ig domain